MSKLPRRSTPNKIALSKVFMHHGLLLIADSFSEYEHRVQSLKEGIFLDEPNSAAMAAKLWRVLEKFLDLDDVQDDDALSKFASSDKFYIIAEQLEVIRQCFLAIQRSIDFEAVLSKQIDKVLKPTKMPRTVLEFLTPEQEVAVKKIVSDVDHWAHSESEPSADLWHMLLTAQNDIAAKGELSDQSTANLFNIQQTRSGARRQRLYADYVLSILLAEFFEYYNEFGWKASMSDDPYHSGKSLHDALEAEKSESERIPWKPKFTSPYFYEFFESYLDHYNIGPIGAASVQKVIKHRNRFGGLKLGPLLGQASGPEEFSQIFEFIDAIKA